MNRRLRTLSPDQLARLRIDLEALGDTLHEQINIAETAAALRVAFGPDTPAAPARARWARAWYRSGQPDLWPGETQPPPPPIEERISIIPSADGDYLEVNARGQSLVRNVAELIEASEIDTEKWAPTGTPKINTWTTAMNGPDGEPVIVRNWQVTARFERRLDADRMAPPATSFAIGRSKPTPRADGRELALFISDPQIGFRRDRRGRLIPMHDRRALDLNLQLAALLQPEIIVWLGDNIDAAEASDKFPAVASMVDTAHPAILELRYWLAQCRATCPDARIVVLEGNHGDRLRRVVEKQLAGFAVCQLPGETRPAFGLEALIRPEDFGAEYVAPYGTHIGLWGRVDVSHGGKVRAGGGATVAALLRDATDSCVVGHIHRAEVAHRTLHTLAGRREIFAASPGATCRVWPGVVPGVKPDQDWQQATGIASFDLERCTAAFELLRIDRGRLYLHGGRLDGRDQTADVERETGWPMAHDWLQPGE